MYQPKIKDDQIRRLYKVRKAQKRPMTKVVAEALEQYLAKHDHIVEVDKMVVDK